MDSERCNGMLFYISLRLTQCMVDVPGSAEAIFACQGVISTHQMFRQNVNSCGFYWDSMCFA